MKTGIKALLAMIIFIIIAVIATYMWQIIDNKFPNFWGYFGIGIVSLAVVMSLYLVFYKIVTFLED